MSIAVTLTEPPSIGSRDDLIAAIKDEQNRDDVADNSVKRHLQLVEAEINRRLRVPDMEMVAGLQLASGAANLPDEFLAMRAVYDADKCIIPAVDPMQLIETRPYGEKVYSLIGGQLRVAPDSDELVTCIYYRSIPRLIADEPTNWLLDKHPDIYLHGINARFANFVQDTDTAAREFQLFERAIDQLMMAALHDRYGGPLRQRGTMRQVRGPRA
jgi:hypothetical protein